MWQTAMLGMPKITVTVKAAVVVGIILVIAMMGYRYAAALAKVDLLQCQQSAGEMMIVAEQDARRRLGEAVMAERAVIQESQVRIDKLNSLLEVAREKIETLTDGRTCLSVPARRVLDNAIKSSAADRVSENTASTAGSFAATAAAAQRKGSTVSDRELSSWVLTAVRSYEMCRDRLYAIKSWDGDLHGR